MIATRRMLLRELENLRREATYLENATGSAAASKLIALRHREQELAALVAACPRELVS